MRSRCRPKPPRPGSGDWPGPPPPSATPSARCPPGGTTWRADRVRGRWDDDGPATAECSLRLDPGERIALVGASGSGKSTLAALLVRFLDPASGQLWHGGQELRGLALDDVRRFTGLVDDDPHVFATTLVENVRLARPGATDAEVADALCRARLGGWLAGLPEGLDTWLGDGHAGLSGGERARLGVARSLLADQPVLVLDEPAGHLDHATATELAHELLTGARTRSVLWITHTDVGLDLVDRVVDLTSSAPDPPSTRALGTDAGLRSGRGTALLGSAHWAQLPGAAASGPTGGQAHLDVDDGASGRTEHDGVEVELGDLGNVEGEPPEGHHELLHLGRGRPSARRGSRSAAERSAATTRPARRRRTRSVAAGRLGRPRRSVAMPPAATMTRGPRDASRTSPAASSVPDTIGCTSTSGAWPRTSRKCR